MRFRVLGKETEGEVYFALREESNGGILLYACNSIGGEKLRGNILAITPEGKLKLIRGINTAIGLQFDKDSKIQLEE